MEQALAGKVAIVTGAASGIGRATALLFAGQGADLVLVDRDGAGLQSVMDAIADIPAPTGRMLLNVTLDLGERADCAHLVELVSGLERVHILINAAGMPSNQIGFLDMDEADWDRIHNVNLRAPMLLMQAAGRRRVAHGQGGRIFNVTSSAACRAGLAQAGYASSKAALTQLTRNVAAELGGHGINVNAVAPGVTATPMALGWFKEKAVMAQEAKPGGSVANLLHQVADAEDVAATILFLCLDASRQITAQTIHTSAGTVV
jgi:NAD(P)-dependent dehydrogenase (short-subunit alcohol dehydrogenase family)